jgi:transcriptional regulator with XRE-family HTH domain
MRFDERRFFEAVEQQRRGSGASWRQIAGQLSLSPSTFSRLAQGRRPDVDTFVKLLAWMHRPASDFMDDDLTATAAAQAAVPDTVGAIAESLRADPTLDAQSAEAMEDIVRVAYHRLRSVQQ